MDYVNPETEKLIGLIEQLETLKKDVLKQASHSVDLVVTGVITDKAEIEKYIRDGQSFYLMDNTDVTYVMAEFEGDEAGAVIGNCYIIP